MSRDTGSLDKYRDTVLVFPDHGGLRVPVCQALDDSQVAKLKALGLGEAFAVVTPCNPRGETLDAAENAHRIELMLQELRAARIRHVRADGWSLVDIHVERGFACAVDMVDAEALARQWEQEAMWWWEGRVLELRSNP